jgi:hypothetical protein
MRKKLYRTAVPFALSVVLLSSCVPFIYDDDDSVASGKIDTFLTAIEKGDTASVKATFALSTVATLTDFDQQVSNLIAYYQGEHSRRLTLTVGSHERLEYGKHAKVVLISTDLLTTKEPFRCAYTWCWQDDFDSQNVGISFFAIIRYYEDIERDYAYWGGTDKTPGIHLGEKSPTHED